MRQAAIANREATANETTTVEQLRTGSFPVWRFDERFQHRISEFGKRKRPLRRYGMFPSYLPYVALKGVEPATGWSDSLSV